MFGSLKEEKEEVNLCGDSVVFTLRYFSLIEGGKELRLIKDCGYHMKSNDGSIGKSEILNNLGDYEFYKNEVINRKKAELEKIGVNQ
jgi:hypothetical protein